MIARLLPALALALAAAFFGIALYITLAEQPARLALADGPSLEQWKISFGVGIMLLGSLTIAAGIAGLGAAFVLRDVRWAVGGALMLTNWPWTLVMIAPTNAVLLATMAEASGPESRALIVHWGLVHSGRTAIALTTTAVFFGAIARPR